MAKQVLSKPKVGLVGYGYWGPNLLRNLAFHGGFEVSGVVELNAELRERVAQHYPYLRVYEHLSQYLEREKPTAVVIATPPEAHKDLALQCMRAGVDVLVEKPLATSVADCDAIISEAERLGRKVMVDHTFAYHAPVRYLAEQVQKGSLGDLYYYDSVRVNLGRFQAHTNVLWDLGPHDLSILELLLPGQSPTMLTAVGAKHFGNSTENICYVHLTYPNGFVAHLHLNWISPVKIRTILLGGSKKMAVYDENLPVEKIKIYDKGVNVRSQANSKERRVNYREGDMVAPAISPREALAYMISAFHTYLTEGKAPALDMYGGRRIVNLLEKCETSLANGGEPCHLGENTTHRKAVTPRAA